MNEIELTKLFVEYKETTNRLAELEAIIKDEVLVLGDSQKIAGVKATYYRASTEYDYEAAAKSMNPSNELVDDFSTVTKRPRWKEIAEYCAADIESFSIEKPARVVIKV